MEFKIIEQYPKYEVSRYGVVREVETKKVRNTYLTNKGYRYVAMNGYKPIKKLTIHRIVAEAFILNIHSKPQVNHKNGVKTDNRSNNLEWMTNNENRQHAVKKGTIAFGERMGNSKLKNNDIPVIKNLLLKGMEQSVIAKLYGVSQPTVSEISTGKKWIRCYEGS